MLSIFAEILRQVIEWLKAMWFRPKLELVSYIRKDTVILKGFATLRFSIRNSGRIAGKNAVIDLFIYQPNWISPQSGLVINQDACHEESTGSRVPSDMLESEKPNHFKFRLNQDVYVDPGKELEVAHTKLLAMDYNADPERLNYDLRWEIAHEGIPSKEGRITYKGTDLKKILLSDLPRAYREPPE